MKALRFDAAAWAAFAVGAALFLLLYGPATLNPTYDSWIFNGYIGVDILQHYAGWAAFRAGEWALPLTFTSYLGWPLGGAASLTDCIPLFALAAKLLDPLLPETFQYFGWFVLLCMAMGSYAGAKLLSCFGFSAAGRVMGSVLFAASPILLERAFQHTALAAHFVVVLALYVYFRARRGSFQALAWAFVPLAALACAIHVYFVPMVLAIAFAYSVDALLAQKRGGVLWPLGAAVAAALGVALALGFFSSAEYVPGGYGQFGMNLNAFWNPASWNWATWDASYQNLDWSRFLPMLPVVGDSLGSFAYLGLGVLLGLGLAGVMLLWRLARQWRRGGAAVGNAMWAFVKSHAGLLFSCLCLAIFAVSNVVTANSRTLFVLPLPQLILRLYDMFRSSGRLIWPVYYLLVLLALWGVRAAALALGARLAVSSKGLGRAIPAVALGLLLLVQGVDLSHVLRQKHDYFAVPVVPESYHAPENWDRLAQPGRVLYQLELNEDRPMALRAALAGMPSNYYLLARGTPGALQAHMAGTRQALENGEIPFGNAVFITKDEALATSLATVLAGVCEVFPCAGYTVFLPLAI